MVSGRCGFLKSVVRMLRTMTRTMTRRESIGVPLGRLVKILQHPGFGVWYQIVKNTAPVAQGIERQASNLQVPRSSRGGRAPKYRGISTDRLDSFASRARMVRVMVRIFWGGRR